MIKTHCVLFVLVFNTSDYFLLKILPLYWHSIIRVLKSCITLIRCVLQRKIHGLQSHGLMKDNIKFELRVRRTYGLLPVLSWFTTWFWIRLWAGRQKFGTIRLIAYMHICNLCGLRTRWVEIWGEYCLLLLLSSFITWSRNKFPSRIRISFLTFSLTILHKFGFETSETSITWFLCIFKIEIPREWIQYVQQYVCNVCNISQTKLAAEFQMSQRLY